MVIVCESCQTRFHLADGRIGPQGARVRCSNCHHRFHVVPPGSPGSPGGPDDSVAAPADPPASPAPGEEPRRAPVGDPDLDNPEFLFDADPGASTDTLPTGPVNFADAGVSLSGEMTQMHEVDPDEPEPTLGDPEEDTPLPPDDRPGTPVFGMDAEVSQRQQELSGSGHLDLGDTGFGGGRAMEVELDGEAGVAHDPPVAEPLAVGVEPVTGSSIEPLEAESLALSDEEPPPLADVGSAMEVPDPGDIDDAIRSAFDDEDPLADWDPLADPGVAAAAERRSEPPLRVVPAAEATASAGPASSVETPADLEDPGAADPAWVRVAAVLVGALLLAGAVRQSIQQYYPVPGPESVRGAGWVARDVSVEPARDAAGQRLLIVRGRLDEGAGAPAPRVSARLVAGNGSMLDGTNAGVVLRRGDPPPQPGDLERLLSAQVRPARGQVVGFAVPLRAPDPRAARVRVVLEESPRERFEARRSSPPATESAIPSAPVDPAADGPDPGTPAALDAPE